jgi:anti-sigma factor RsiW
MTCRELADLLVDYITGELADERCAMIRSHLDECAECVHFVETYQVTIQITRQLPVASAPEQLLERIKKALEEDQKS